MPKKKRIVQPEDSWGDNDKIGSRILRLRLRCREVELAMLGGGAIADAERLKQEAIVLLHQRRAVLARLKELTGTYQDDRAMLLRLVAVKRLMRKYRLPRVTAWNLQLQIERQTHNGK